jgi:cell division protein FtsA
VLREDISQVVDVAQEILLDEGREVLHVLPRGFWIDGHGGILNPLGMIGMQLELDATVVTAQMGPIRNIYRLLEIAGVEPLGLVLQPLASAEAVLTQEEKDLGVVLVDIGGGTSDVMVYADGAPRYVGVVGLGGRTLRATLQRRSKSACKKPSDSKGSMGVPANGSLRKPRIRKK